MQFALRMRLIAYIVRPFVFAAVLNLCRDEICNSLKNKVEAVFGEPFNLHGLGAVLTCGTTGIGACLSHAPQAHKGAREKYGESPDIS